LSSTTQSSRKLSVTLGWQEIPEDIRVVCGDPLEKCSVLKNLWSWYQPGWLFLSSNCRLWRRTPAVRGRLVTTLTISSQPKNHQPSISRRANSSATLTSAQRLSFCLRLPTRLSLLFSRVTAWDMARLLAPPQI